MKIVGVETAFDRAMDHDGHLDRVRLALPDKMSAEKKAECNAAFMCMKREYVEGRR